MTATPPIALDASRSRAGRSSPASALPRARGTAVPPDHPHRRRPRPRRGVTLRSLHPRADRRARHPSLLPRRDPLARGDGRRAGSACRRSRPRTGRGCRSSSPPTPATRSCRTWARPTARTASRSGRSRSRSARSTIPIWSETSPASCATTTGRWASGWRCIRRSTSRRSRAGRGRRRASAPIPLLTSRLLTAFLEGLQGPEIGGDSVAATVKHFPGGGPQLDGEDPHFAYGREQVYPGGRFEDHLMPFRAAIAAGAAAIMPYYGMPVGLTRNGKADRRGRLRLQPRPHHRPPARRTRVRRRRPQRLRARARRGGVRKAVPGAGVGSRAPRPR